MDKTLKSSFSLILSKNKVKNMIPQSSAVSLPSVRPLAHSWPTAGPNYSWKHTFIFLKNKNLFVAIYMQTLQLVLKNI